MSSFFPITPRAIQVFNHAAKASRKHPKHTSSCGDAPSPEYIDQLILCDHKRFRKMYSVFDTLKDGEHVGATRWKNLLIYELSRHIMAEELVLYPRISEVLGSDIADHTRNEHQQLKEAMLEVDQLDTSDVRLTDRVHQMMSVLNRHTENEELVLKRFGEALTEEQRSHLGKLFNEHKTAVPTHPHPNAPDSGGSYERIMAGLFIPVDRLRDLMRAFPEEEEVKRVMKDQA
jgi:hemerythrin-like domain-containing protein